MRNCKTCGIELTDLTWNPSSKEGGNLCCKFCKRKADGFFDALQLAAKINAEGQAREQQLLEALEYYASFDYSDDSCPVAEDAQQALALPQDDTALRQWGAKLLREVAKGGCTHVHVLRKADELEAGK
jgi:hypothetical protein